MLSADDGKYALELAPPVSYNLLILEQYKQHQHTNKTYFFDITMFTGFNKDLVKT